MVQTAMSTSVLWGHVDLCEAGDDTVIDRPFLDCGWHFAKLEPAT